MQSFLNSQDDGYTDWHPIVRSITEGAKDYEWTLRNMSHEEIARLFVMQQMAVARQHYDPDRT